MSDTIPSEVIATYTTGGATFEIDHLGIGNPDQWGEFAVYRDDVQVAEFVTDAAGYLPAHRPELPDTATLIALAAQAVADAEREAVSKPCPQASADTGPYAVTPAGVHAPVRSCTPDAGGGVTR
jgi:hypothetical protein